MITSQLAEIGNKQKDSIRSNKLNNILKSAFVCFGFLGNFALQNSFYYISNNLFEKKISRSDPFSFKIYLFFFLKFRNILINSFNIKSKIVYTI